MPAKGKKVVLHRLVDFFVSIRLTIVVLIILSIVCVIGTLIPQNDSPDNYLRLYKESTYHLFKALGFLDLFHSWWFIPLITLFTINLVACSLNRLPRVWRLIFHGKTVLDESLLHGLSSVKKFNLKQFNADQEQRFERIIGKHLRKPVLIKSSSEWNFFTERGHYTRLGFYLTHLGLIIIIAGAIAGLLGFQGYMQLVEGETSNQVALRNSFEVRQLDFSIRCDKFEITYYGGSQMPKDYKSMLTVVENGRDVLTKVIEVNDPLIYGGIYFYQSSYGPAANKASEVILRVTPKNSGEPEDIKLQAGKTVSLHNTPYQIRVDQFLADFTMGTDGKPFSKSAQLNNPAAYISVLKNGTIEYGTWVFAKFPDFHKQEDRLFDISMVNLNPAMYTGLQVTRDPGVWIVWLGCALLIIGTYVAFFTSHRRIWLRIEEKDGEYKAVLAGSTNKNHAQFNRDFETLFKNLKA
jgi:cytochrome c biogenesis protein